MYLDKLCLTGCCWEREHNGRAAAAAPVVFIPPTGSSEDLAAAVPVGSCGQLFGQQKF